MIEYILPVVHDLMLLLYCPMLATEVLGIVHLRTDSIDALRREEAWDFGGQKYVSDIVRYLSESSVGEGFLQVQNCQI